MSDSSTTPDVLLARVQWVRSMAQELVSDPATADDIGQDAWLSALSGMAASKPDHRGWWAGVVRHAMLRMRRGEMRRQRAETSAPVPDAAPSTDAAVARAELHRELVNALDRLPDATRTTLILRYFEGMSAREIAARQSEPIATVRSRIQRGLAQLRDVLDRRSGSRARWAVPVIAAYGCPWSRAGWSTLSLGAAATCLVGLLGVAVWFATTWADPRSPGDSSTELPPNVESVDVASVSRLEEPRAPGPIAGDVSSATSSAPETLRVLVIDLDGRPVPGAVLATDDHTWVADATGAFDAQRDDVRRMRDPRDGWRVFGVGWPMRPVRDEALQLLLVPMQRLNGQLVDGAARPVVGATVTWQHRVEALVECPYVWASNASYRAPETATSDDEGWFSLRVPVVSGVRIRAKAAGFQPSDRPWPDGPFVRWELVERDDPDRPVFFGQVIGAASHDVTVALGRDVRRVRGDAPFRFEFDPEAEGLRIVVPGRAPQVIPQVAWRPWRDAEAMGPVRLDAPARASALSGVVVNAQGDRLEGVQVELHDPTRLEVSFRSMEARSAGRGAPVTTDSDGSFVLDGLAERDYRLRFWRDDLGTWVTTPFPAGRRDLRLVWPSDALRPSAQGWVRTASGAAIEGAVLRVGFPTAVSWGGGELAEKLTSTVSAADGSFSLGAHPRRDASISVEAEGFAVERWPVERLDHSAVLTLSPTQRLHATTQRDARFVEMRTAENVVLPFTLHTVDDDVVVERWSPPSTAWPLFQVSGRAAWIDVMWLDGSSQRMAIPRDTGRTVRLNLDE